MSGNSGKRWWFVVVALITVTGAAWAAERTWTDATGKHSLKADFVRVEGEQVVLRRDDGKEIKVPLKRLSKKDRAFVAALRADEPAIDPEVAAQQVAKTAKEFFGDLRSSSRDTARKMLTAKAMPLMESEKSPLHQLPKPASGASSIRPGKVQLEGTVAEIPVQVRASGRFHKTKLHLRYEDDQWRVFAISATYGDGEKSINFEAEGVTQEDVDPLQALVGKPLELAGTTIDGSPLEMANFQGKVVLVDFWATWCGPCRAEIPNILANWKKYHDDGFEVIAISVDQDIKALASFVAQEQPPWTVVADNHPKTKQKMGAKYGIRGIPAFVLLGRDGKVAAVHCRGPLLGRELAKLLGESGERLSSTDARQLR